MPCLRSRHAPRFSRQFYTTSIATWVSRLTTQEYHDASIEYYHNHRNGDVFSWEEYLEDLAQQEIVEDDRENLIEDARHDVEEELRMDMRLEARERRVNAARELGSRALEALGYNDHDGVGQVRQHGYRGERNATPKPEEVPVERHNARIGQHGSPAEDDEVNKAPVPTEDGPSDPFIAIRGRSAGRNAQLVEEDVTNRFQNIAISIGRNQRDAGLPAYDDTDRRGPDLYGENDDDTQAGFARRPKAHDDHTGDLPARNTGRNDGGTTSSLPLRGSNLGIASQAADCQNVPPHPPAGDNFPLEEGFNEDSTGRILGSRIGRGDQPQGGQYRPEVGLSDARSTRRGATPRKNNGGGTMVDDHEDDAKAGPSQRHKAPTKRAVEREGDCSGRVGTKELTDHPTAGHAGLQPGGVPSRPDDSRRLTARNEPSHPRVGQPLRRDAPTTVAAGDEGMIEPVREISKNEMSR